MLLNDYFSQAAVYHMRVFFIFCYFQSNFCYKMTLETLCEICTGYKNQINFSRSVSMVVKLILEIIVKGQGTNQEQV